MRRRIILFFVAILISLLAVGGAFTVMSGKDFGEEFVSLIAMNFPVCVLIGYIDYLVITRINNILSAKKEVLVITVNVLVLSGVCFIVIYSLNLLLSDWTPVMTMRYALCSLPWNLIIVMMLEAMYYSRQREIAAKERAQFQFEVLKHQLNPHFLFNSLNTLASLAYTNPQRANQFTKYLSNVYRYLLDTQNTSLVTIDKELAFVRQYLQLEQIRYGDRLRIIIDEGLCHHNYKVIPTGIQILVENAIKHNVCTEVAPLEIKISVLNDCIEVANNLNPRTSVHSYGIGLRNLSKQYSLHNREIECFKDISKFIVRLPIIQ